MDVVKWKGREIFDPERCDRCGKCLAECPVLGLDEEGGRREIENLIRGRDLKTVIEQCTTCLGCNLYCESGLLPYELILWRWYERYLDKGLPGLARVVMPNEPLSLWRHLRPYFSETERKNMEAWAKPPKGSEVILTGGMTSLFPYLLESKLFKDVEIVGTEDFWICGALYYQLGLFDLVEKIGFMVRDRFKQMGLKKVIPFYAAEYVMLTKIFPRIYGIEFDLEIIDLESWLLDRIKSGKIEIKKKLDMTVTFQDSCWSKALGAEFFDLARELVSLTGANIVEMENCREHSLCCGFGAGAGRYNIADIIRYTGMRLRQAGETGADALVTHCTGCLFILSFGLAVRRSNAFPIYHLSQLLAMASGEEVFERNAQRGRQIVKALIRAGARHPILLMKRFFVDGPAV